MAIQWIFLVLGIFIMIHSINYVFYCGQMSITQRQGVITCTHKEGKDKQSSCIAARLKKVLPKLISEEQKGFLKGRYKGENTKLLYDTLLYTNKHQVPDLLLMVDFEKAFDCVAWSFIETSLNKYNFGHDIKRWISAFYANLNSCMYVNGQYSEWFDVRRCTRQGDPLSPYLFLMCAEMLSSMIHQNKNIHGIKILDEEILLSQF